MANYLPHSTKKLSALQNREFKLFRLIHDQAEKRKIIAAAKQVQQARVRAIEAFVASRGPRSAQESVYDAQIKMIHGLAPDVVLANYGYDLCGAAARNDSAIAEE